MARIQKRRHDRPIDKRLARFIGERIRTARLEAGLTQTALRRKMRRCNVWMIRMEKGYFQIKALDFYRLAEATGKKVGWFVGELDGRK